MIINMIINHNQNHLIMSLVRRQITWARGNIMFHSGKKRARHSKVTLMMTIMMIMLAMMMIIITIILTIDQVSVSGKGGLKIKTIGFKDSGIYTCMGKIVI